MQKPDDYRATHCVKRIAFGFDRCEYVKSLLKLEGSNWRLVERQASAGGHGGRYDYTHSLITVDNIEVRLFDHYESNAPSELYVVVDKRTTYKSLKEILGIK